MASWKIDDMSLSIITINYNNLDGLKKTVDSVLSQTWRDFEWIIVDGGSTDGSKEYIESLAQSLSEGTAIDGVQWTVERFSLPGFTAEDLKGNTSDSGLYQSSTDNRQSPIANRPQRLLWCSESDKGVYNAMNKGIAKAQGEYLNFMNSGDCFYERETLQKVLSEKRQSDIIYGDWLQIFKDHEVVSHFSDIAGIYSIEKNNICQQSMFVKSQLLKENGFDESYRLYADWKRWIQAALDCGTFLFVPIIICRYDMQGISSTDPNTTSEKARIRKELYSSMFLNTLNTIDYYNDTRAIVRLQAFLKKGGVIAWLLKSILKVCDRMFLRIDFKKNAIIGEANY